jgi:hypothetical protein
MKNEKTGKCSALIFGVLKMGIDSLSGDFQDQEKYRQGIARRGF